MSEEDSVFTPLTYSFELRRYHAERLENARRLAPQVAARLRVAGVARLEVEYDGCGDSGQIESVLAFDAGGSEVEPSSENGLKSMELETLFYDLLEARHPGWENNDGAFGEFKWNLTTEELAHVHNDRFTDYETTEHQGV